MSDQATDEWGERREAINLMAERWSRGLRDEWSVRPEVATFSLAVLFELETKAKQPPQLLPEENGGLAFTWEGSGGTRYMFFAEDYLEESVLTKNGRRWIEVSYAEKKER